MKVLIWFLCFFGFIIIQMLFRYLGLPLGAIPLCILFSLTWWCARHLCKTWDIRKKREEESNVMNNVSPDERSAIDEVIAVCAIEGRTAIEANAEAQTHNLGDPEYGLVPEKPIYCCFVDGSKKYLNSLRTDSGDRLDWTRRGSTSAEGIHGMIDVYDGYLPSGQKYKTLYVNMYSASNSTAVPVGFRFSKTSNPRKQKRTKQRFCKYCGGAIDPATKKCGKCGKQFFNWKRNIATIVVTILVIISLLLGGLCVYQSITHKREVDKFEKTIEQQSAWLESKNKRLTDSQKELQELREKYWALWLTNQFYDSCVVFVSNNGTVLYHKYGCDDFDSSSFWAYNIEQAIGKGYKPCPECCDE